MSDKEEPARARIIQALISSLKPLEYVHAFYEGGAPAFGRLDEWSDIDLYAIVDDNRVDQTFSVIEKALSKISTIERKYPVLQQPWPGIFQAFCRLKNTSKYLLIDLAILQISNEEKFLEPKIHGNNVFHFNKLPKKSSQLASTRIASTRRFVRKRKDRRRVSTCSTFSCKKRLTGATASKP